MKSVVDELRGLVDKDENLDDDETMQQTLTNLSNSLLQLSENLAQDTADNTHSYSIRDMKDIATIINTLSSVGKDDETIGAGQLPSAPAPVNVFYNNALGATQRESEDDDNSDISQGLDQLNNEQIEDLIDKANSLTNQANYEN